MHSRIILCCLLIILVESQLESLYVRDKRYVLRTKRWHKRSLTWKLKTDNLLESDVFIVRNTLHRAFNEWQSASSVRFFEVQSNSDTPVDITIAFERRDHSDGYPFDGEDGVVAHAFYPRDGRLHFDADEKWSLNTAEGVNLFQTAVHEIGHLLGLEHSIDSRAAMFAARKPYDPNFSLGDDDVRAIRAIFPIEARKDEKADEVKSTTEIPSTTTTTSPEITTTTISSRPPISPFFPFPLPPIEHFQRRPDWFAL